MFQSLHTSEIQPGSSVGPLGGRPERASELRQLGTRRGRNLHPALHRKSGLGFAQTSRVFDRSVRVHFEVDGTAESEHGVVGDVDDGDDQVDRSAAGTVRLGSGYWISIKVFKVLHFGSL